MRLHRFYITDTIGDDKKVTITSPDLVHQMLNVFRLGVGDEIIVFNGTGFDYVCKIDTINKKSIIVSNSVISLSVVDSKRNNFTSRRRLFLCAAIVKRDTFEWIVEKATELGVTDIVPVIAERSEKKSLNEERLNKIAVEASEQSGRDTTPMVHTIMGVAGAVEMIRVIPAKAGIQEGEIKMLAFHTCLGLTSTEGKNQNGEAGNYFQMHRLNLDKEVPLAVFIGPEGGWSPTEIEMFHKENIPVVCLGPQILRSETAVVAALSMVVFG